MDRRTVSLDDGSLRFRYFGKFQCGIAVFYYFLCGFAVFGPSLRPPPYFRHSIKVLDSVDHETNKFHRIFQIDLLS